MFWTRLASGAVLMLIAALGFFFGAPVLTLVLFGTSVAGYRELMTALGESAPDGKRRYGAPEIAGYAGITVLYLLLLFLDYDLFPWDRISCLFGVVVVLFIAELFIYVFCFPRYRAEQIASCEFAFLYVPVMLSFVELTRMAEGGEYLVWIILISSWGCDTCAYVVGMLIGKKKIFPVLSPKKSLEGCIGGVVGAALLGALYGLFVTGNTAQELGTFALICAMGAVVSMVGDLAASAIKRHRGIKDYGKLIPGHGGVMDRFDSVIVTAPIVYLLTVLMMG